nr:PREDICTED: uncharacterized protein LOC105662505 isoform X2 [Megachile rotundata]
MSNTRISLVDNAGDAKAEQLDSLKKRPVTFLSRNIKIRQCHSTIRAACFHCDTPSTSQHNAITSNESRKQLTEERELTMRHCVHIRDEEQRREAQTATDACVLTSREELARVQARGNKTEEEKKEKQST